MNLPNMNEIALEAMDLAVKQIRSSMRDIVLDMIGFKHGWNGIHPKDKAFMEFEIASMPEYRAMRTQIMEEVKKSCFVKP